MTGHGLRELDIELMRRLSPRVNVIPVIGKADSLTPLELAESKKLIMEDIEHYRIPVYVLTVTRLVLVDGESNDVLTAAVATTSLTTSRRTTRTPSRRTRSSVV